MLISVSTTMLALFSVAASPNCADLFSSNQLERWYRWSESREWRMSGEVGLARTASGHRLLKSFVLVGLGPDHRVYVMTDYEPVYFVEDGGGTMSFSLNQVDDVETKEISCFSPDYGVFYISRPVGVVGKLSIAIFGVNEFDRAVGFSEKLRLLPRVNEICAMSLGDNYAKLKSEEFGVYDVEYGGWAASDARIFPGGGLEIIHEVDSRLERIEGQIRACED